LHSKIKKMFFSLLNKFILFGIVWRSWIETSKNIFLFILLKRKQLRFFRNFIFKFKCVFSWLDFLFWPTMAENESSFLKTFLMSTSSKDVAPRSFLLKKSHLSVRKRNKIRKLNSCLFQNQFTFVFIDIYYNSFSLRN
jgi:hypothetical protein